MTSLPSDHSISLSDDSDSWLGRDFSLREIAKAFLPTEEGCDVLALATLFEVGIGTISSIPLDPRGDDRFAEGNS